MCRMAVSELATEAIIDSAILNGLLQIGLTYTNPI